MIINTMYSLPANGTTDKATTVTKNALITSILIPNHLKEERLSINEYNSLLSDSIKNIT